MVTFSAQITPYDLDDFSDVTGGLGWMLDASRCALLVHDVLPYYLRVLDPNQAGVLVATLEGIVAAAQRAGIPVIASAPRPAHDLRQHGVGGRLWGLGPSPDEATTTSVRGLSAETTWVRKRSLSAFLATDLDVELRRLHRDQLLIVGVFASVGIIATTFDALARDIEVFVVSDAVADYDAELHRLALAQVGRSTGEVVTTDMVLGAFDAASSDRANVAESE